MLSNCLYCKNNSIRVLNKEIFNIFSINTVACPACQRVWKDFEGTNDDTDSPIISIQRLSSSNN